MTPWTYGLIAASAALPTWALLRYVRRANEHLVDMRARSSPTYTWDDFDAYNSRNLVGEAKAARDDYLLDAVLIGAGMLCGGVASVLSLHG